MMLLVQLLFHLHCTPLLPFSHSFSPALSDPLSVLGWCLSQGKALFPAGQTVALGEG